MATDPNYSEILAVKIKTDDFSAGITKLIEEWNRFKNSVGKDNVGTAIGAGAFAGISKSLEAIQETLNAMYGKVTANMDAMANSATKSIASVKTAAEEAVDAVDAANKKLDSDKFKRIRPGKVVDSTGNETRESVQAAEEQARAKRQQDVYDSFNAIDKDRLAQQKQIQKEEDEMYAARDRDIAERRKTELQATKELNTSLVAQEVEKNRQIDEAYAHESPEAKRAREMDRMWGNNPIDDYSTSLPTPDEHIQALKQQQAVIDAEREKLFEQHEKEQRLHEEAGAEYEGQQKYDRSYNPYFGGIENETGSLKPGRRPAEKPSVFGNLGEDFVNLAKITLEFKAISAVLDGLDAVVSAPFRALKEGEEYLKKTQQDATNLEAALLSSVRFSKDLGQNLKDTQVGSAAVARALQDIVINSPGLKLQDVTSSFKIISESIGGEGGIDTLQKMLDLTQQFSVAIRASGVDVQVTRRLASELPKLFSGTLEENSPLARILGKSNVELKELVANGIKFNDLQERLAPLLASVAAQLKDSKDTLESTEERADLLAKRLEGTFASASVKSYQDELQRLITIMNSDSFSQQAKGIGEMAEAWGVFKAAISGIPEFFAFLHEHPLVQALVTGGHVTSPPSPSLNPNEIPDGKGGYKTADRVSADGRTRYNFNGPKIHFDQGPTREQLGAPSDDILQKQFSSAGEKRDLTKHKAAPFDVSDISTHVAEYREKLQELTAEFEHAKQAEEELVAGGSENKTVESMHIKADATLTIAKAIGVYNSALDTLNADHKKEIGNIYAVSAENKKVTGKGTDPATLAKDIHEADKRYDTAKIELIKNFNTTKESLLAQEVAAEKAALAEIQAIRKANFEASIEMAKKEAEFDIALAEGRVKLVSQGFGAGLNSQSDVNASKQFSLDARKAALLKEGDSIENSYIDAIAHTSSGTTDRTSATNKYNAANADLALKFLGITQEQQQLDLEIYTTEEKLNQARVETYLKLIDLSLQYREAQESQRFTGQQIIDRTLGNNGKRNEDTHYSNLEAIRSDTLTNLTKKKDELQYQLSLQHSVATQLRLEQEIAQVTTQIAQTKAGSVSDLNERLNKIASGNGTQAEKITQEKSELRKRLGKTTDGTEADSIEQKLKDLDNPLTQFKNNLIELVPGLRSAIDAFESAKDVGDKMGEAGAAVSAFSAIVSGVQQAIGVFQQGKAAGGTLGGVGSVLSTYGGLVPVAGPFIQAAGQIMSIVGGIFVKQAQHVVDNVKSQFDFTIRQLNNGTESLNNSLNAVIQERQQAITQLSGIKGGQDQLKNILPQLDAEIAQLQQQQRQISIDFANSYNELAIQIDAGSNVGSQILQNWVSINQQVYTYINATGNATEATKFLSMTLQQLQITSQQQLNQGEQQAVQNAISLNQQLLQRTQLIESLNEQVFALQNQDSEERTQAGAVTRAQQIQQLQRNSQQQLQDLNFQIDQSQQIVAAESTIFSISSDIYDLHAEDTRLTLAALTTQLNGYQQLKDIIASITKDANGLFTSSIDWLKPITNPVLNGPQLNFASGAISVTIVSENGDMSNVTADSIAAAINQAARSGTPFA